MCLEGGRSGHGSPSSEGHGRVRPQTREIRGPDRPSLPQALKNRLELATDASTPSPQRSAGRYDRAPQPFALAGGEPVVIHSAHQNSI